MVEACQRLRMYLLGKQFLIVTDCSAISSVKALKPTTEDWVYMMQREDESLRDIIDVLRGDEQSHQQKQYLNEYIMKKNRLFRKGVGDTLVSIQFWRIH